MLKLFLFLLFGNLLDFVILVCPPLDPEENCFTQQEFEDEIRKSTELIELMNFNLTSSLEIPGFLLTPKDPAYAHFSTHDINEKALNDEFTVKIVNEALSSLKSRFNLSKAQLRSCINRENINVNNICTPLKIDCDPSSTNYYRFDGQCNNVKNPSWGAKLTPMVRVFDDGFIDGIETLSAARTFESARFDSLSANDAKGRNDQKVPEINSDKSTSIGQIITHELMKTKKIQLHSNKRKGGFNCCTSKNEDLADLIHSNKNCLPISLKANDPCYSNGNFANCLNYIKSFRSFDNCQLNSSATLLNFHNAPIDFELVYNEASLAHLEANRGKFNLNNFSQIKEILVGQDDRSMQLPGLLVFLHFFLKLHNSVFDELKIFKSSMSTSVLSFEARKITTGVFQNILLEFFMSVLPEKQAAEIDSFFNCYDPKLNPQVSIEFNLAMRDFHYFIRESISTYSESSFLKPNGLRGLRPFDLPFADCIDNVNIFTENRCGITHGLLDVGWNLAGVGDAVHCKFFAADKSFPGTDLRSLDYQAGRETGEPSYGDILRKFHGINKCNDDISKRDFVKHLPSVRDMFARRFKENIAEIGYTLATDFEDKEGQILGPTNSLIIAEQLRRTVCGDRFWFSNGRTFRNDQADRIRKINFFKLTCFALNCNGTRVQADPFLSPGPSNLKKVCPTPSQILAELNLKNW